MPTECERSVNAALPPQPTQSTHSTTANEHIETLNQNSPTTTTTTNITTTTAETTTPTTATPTPTEFNSETLKDTNTINKMDLNGEMSTSQTSNASSTSATTENGHNGSMSNVGGRKTSITSPDPTAYVAKARVTRPTPPPPSYNPMQFVQMKPCSLYQTAQDQLKKAEEVKKIKEVKKEEPEDWQNNLDNWKSSRRKRVEHIIDRVVEVKKLELEEHDRSRRKSKTFSEMIEERGERGGSRGLNKLASLTVYTEDEANDFSDLGIGNSSASGKSSLSEDYDNNSVMSDNVELEKAIRDNGNHKVNSTTREYISSPGYDTSSSTAPASSPDPCEYTYEGAIQDYKQRVSRAASGTTQLATGTPLSSGNTYKLPLGNGLSKTSNSKESTPERQSNNNNSVTKNGGASNGDSTAYPIRRGSKIEDRLIGFEVTSPSDSQEGAEKQKVDVPKIDISKRKEIFECQNANGNANEPKSTNSSGGAPVPRVTLRDRFKLDATATTTSANDSQVAVKKEVKRLSGDITSIRDRLQSLEQSTTTQTNGTKLVDIPVPPLKDRLSSLQNAVTKEEVKKPPVALVDARQLEIMKSEEQKHIKQLSEDISSPIVAVVESTTTITTTKVNSSDGTDVDRDDSGIHTSDDIDVEDRLATERLKQEQEEQLNAAIAALAMEERQLEEAANAVNQIEAEFAELSSSASVALPPLVSSSSSSNNNKTTINTVNSSSNIEPQPCDMEFSINEALELALEAIDKESKTSTTSTTASVLHVEQIESMTTMMETTTMEMKTTMKKTMETSQQQQQTTNTMKQMQVNKRIIQNQQEQQQQQQHVTQIHNKTDEEKKLLQTKIQQQPQQQQTNSNRIDSVESKISNEPIYENVNGSSNNNNNNSNNNNSTSAAMTKTTTTATTTTMESAFELEAQIMPSTATATETITTGTANTTHHNHNNMNDNNNVINMQISGNTNTPTITAASTTNGEHGSSNADKANANDRNAADVDADDDDDDDDDDNDNDNEQTTNATATTPTTAITNANVEHVDVVEPYYQVPKSIEPYYDAPKHLRPVPVYENIDMFYSGEHHTLPLLPPKEKPPPPPAESPPLFDDADSSVDNNTDTWSSDNTYETISSRRQSAAITAALQTAGEQPSPPIKRMNSTKRIKKELRNKRSSFLGIEGSVDDDDSYLELTVAPPPDMAQLLEEERRLEKQLYIKAGLCDSSDTGESRDSGVSENHSRQSSEHYTNSSEENDARIESPLSSLRATSPLPPPAPSSTTTAATTAELIYQNEPALLTAAQTPLLQTVKGNSAESWTESATVAAAASKSLTEATATANAKMHSIEEKIREQEEVLRVERELLQLEQEELKRQRENLMLRENMARRELQHGAKMLQSANRHSLQDLNNGLGLPLVVNGGNVGVVGVAGVNGGVFHQPQPHAAHHYAHGHALSYAHHQMPAAAMPHAAQSQPQPQQIYANVPNLQQQFYQVVETDYRKSMSDLNEFSKRLTLPPPTPPTKPMRAMQTTTALSTQQFGGSLVKIATQAMPPTAAPRGAHHYNGVNGGAYQQQQHHQSTQNLNSSGGVGLSALQPGNMSRNTLHALSATPKPKYTDAWVHVQSRSKPAYETSALTNDWLSAYQQKRKSMPEAYHVHNMTTHGSSSNTNNHWLVQEAEQRRLLEQQRRSASTGNTPVHQLNGKKSSGLSSAASMPLATTMTTTTSTSSNGNGKPLPDAIIQTLTERVQSKGIGERKRFDNYTNNMDKSPLHAAALQQQQQLQYQSNLAYRSNHYKQESIIPPSTAAASASAPSSAANTTTPTTPEHNKVLSVSGKKKCSHCGDELGRGAAMIIESLLLFYHINCFKCCVCHVQLGDGLNGTDVRVRNHKLHCQNCYSSDDGIKFSCV